MHSLSLPPKKRHFGNCFGKKGALQLWDSNTKTTRELQKVGCIDPATQTAVASYYTAISPDGERVFNLPLMVAIVLAMIWRQIGEVTQVVRLMQKESLFWAQPRRITQQAFSQRFGSLPAELFLKVLEAVLPVMQVRFQARQRPLPPEVAWARDHYTQVLVQDGSTLDALVRRGGWLSAEG